MAQNESEYHQPFRLCDKDQVVLGDKVFTFRQPNDITTIIGRRLRRLERNRLGVTNSKVSREHTNLSAVDRTL